MKNILKRISYGYLASAASSDDFLHVLACFFLIIAVVIAVLGAISIVPLFMFHDAFDFLVSAFWVSFPSLVYFYIKGAPEHD